MAPQAVKMLVAGAGFMGKAHLEGAAGLDSVEYVGVVDVDESAAKRLAG